LLQLQTKRIVRARRSPTGSGFASEPFTATSVRWKRRGPIGSEAGMGYFLSPGYHLPPVMFTAEEARALLIGGKLIENSATWR